MFKITKKGSSIFIATFITLFLFAAVQAQTFNGSGFTIVDGAGRVSASCSIVPVSGLLGNVALTSISLNNINQTWIGDLEVRVYPPGSTAPPSTTGSVVLTSPPDGRPCNFAGTYRFIDSAATSIDAATVGCSDATNVAPGNYRTSTYGGGANPGPVTSLATSFGTLTAANATGNWLVCVFDFATPDGGAVGSTSITFAPLTAAGATVGGRVSTVGGRGISGAVVTLTDAGGNAKAYLTNPFGYFQFEDVAAGETYVLRVNHKRYSFQNATQVINVNENITDLTITAANE